MNTKLREQLDTIQDMLLEADDEGVLLLWQVLSGLRGPDREEAAPLKEFTTARIRAAAFPKLMNDYGRLSRIAATANPGRVKVNHIRAAEDHFWLHVYLASEALGIIEEDEVSHQGNGS